MKSLITLSLLALSMTTAAFAAEKVGQAQQALGERCWIDASLQYANGGCGNGGDKYMAMTYETDMFGGTSYRIVVQVVDQWNNATMAYDDVFTYNLYTRYRNSDALWTPTNASGYFQARLSVRDAYTDVEVCGAQSPIIYGF